MIILRHAAVIDTTDESKKINVMGKKVIAIIADELDLQNTILIKGDGLVHFYVKNSVNIGNLHTLYSQSFLQLDNNDYLVDTQKVPNVTIFYSGDRDVEIVGTMDVFANIVTKKRCISYSPSVGKIFASKTDLSSHPEVPVMFKGAMISGGNINMKIGKTHGVWGKSFVFPVEGLFYAPKGNIIVESRKPFYVEGNMIAKNI